MAYPIWSFADILIWMCDMTVMALVNIPTKILEKNGCINYSTHYTICLKLVSFLTIPVFLHTILLLEYYKITEYTVTFTWTKPSISPSELFCLTSDLCWEVSSILNIGVSPVPPGLEGSGIGIMSLYSTCGVLFSAGLCILLQKQKVI